LTNAGATSEEITMMVTSIIRRVVVPAIPALSFAACLAPAAPASAAALAVSASCTHSGTRATCNIPVLSATFNSNIHYITAQCNSTGVAFDLKQIQVLAIPPNSTADVSYQVAGNRASAGGVANAGAIVDIYVKINTTSQVLIDFAAAPTGTTSCTASLTVTY
jgi:hypothetical protein